MLAQPSHPQTIYFVDDNFIGNRKATRDLLPHLVEWQKKRKYPLAFACEATLNIAKQTEILRLMQAASFVNIFAGIETPDVDALKHMRKEQNATLPMMDFDPHAQQLRHGGDVGHHHGSGYGHGNVRRPADRVHRAVEKSRFSPSTCCTRCRRRRYGTA